MTRVPEWSELGLRPSVPMSARTRLTSYSPLLGALVAEVDGELSRPHRGIDVPSRAAFATAGGPVATAPILDAARGLLASLDAGQRARLVLPFDAVDKRRWFNVHPNVMRHGLLLEDLSAPARDAALAVVRATLSARGYAQARDVMRINGLLVDITGRPDEFGEWPYFFSIFGDPDTDAPWAWQIDGHHLNVNACVVGDRLSVTPTFMGSEPCTVPAGPLAGTRVFEPETRAGLDLARSLDAATFARACLAPSILRGDLPAELNHPIDGRMVAGAFRDNVSVAHAGVRGDELTDAQRRLLRDVVAAFVGWGRDDHASVRMADVERHLDETSFAWMGAVGDDGPFYYRVLSPVVLVEFDHHPGIVFDNLEPSRHHVHTVVRTPNRGDYGADLLAEHHERFDHVGGTHDPR
jgi:hypothetical protein